jgi:hypothetical protein
MKKVIEAQKDEMTAHRFYSRLASRTKDSHNRPVLERISKDERAHYNILKRYSGKEIRPRRGRLLWYSLMSRILGITFAIKMMEASEVRAQYNYEDMASSIPEVRNIIRDEEEHETELIEMIDERRLKYTGAVIRGLNDGIVEITGEVAGLTFVFQDTTLIATIALITGFVGSLSLASSE